MAFKILTKNGVDNTNIDGARGYYFNAGMRDGIFKGSLNECNFTSLTSNAITLDSGVLSISGHIVVNNEAWTQTFSSAPSTNTRYALVAQIVVDNSSNVAFSLIIQNAATPLVKNNLFATENGAGTYQVEIGRFTLTTTGTVTDITRTLDVITGGSSGMGEHFIVGTITTVVLDVGMNAHVTAEDIYDANGNYQQTNFLFEIPETAGTVVKVNNVEQANLDFTSDPQTQLDNKVDKVAGKGLSENDYTTAEKNKLAGIEAEANKTIVDDALSNSSENPVQNKVVKSALDNVDYMLDQSIKITNQYAVFVNVDFTRYDYKFEIIVSKVGGTSNIVLFPASNNTVLTNWQDRWAYHGLVTTTNNSSPNTFCYARKSDVGGYIWLIDSAVDNKPGHYNNITVEVTWNIETNNTLLFKSSAARAYNENFEVRTCGGEMFSSSLCPQLCLNNGTNSNAEILNGYMRVFKRPRFSV